MNKDLIMGVLNKYSNTDAEWLMQFHGGTTKLIDPMDYHKIAEELSALESEPIPEAKGSAEEWLNKNYHEFMIHWRNTGRKDSFIYKMLEEYASQFNSKVVMPSDADLIAQIEDYIKNKYYPVARSKSEAFHLIYNFMRDKLNK